MMIYWAFIESSRLSYDLGTLKTQYPIWENIYANTIWFFSECSGSTASVLEWMRRGSGQMGLLPRRGGGDESDEERTGAGRCLAERRIGSLLERLGSHQGGRAWEHREDVFLRRFEQRGSRNHYGKGNLGWTQGGLETLVENLRFYSVHIKELEGFEQGYKHGRKCYSRMTMSWVWGGMRHHNLKSLFKEIGRFGGRTS